MPESQELKEFLLQTDEEFRSLSSTHKELDRRLTEIAAKNYPSVDEQREEATIKKRKLQLKDRMEDILRRHRAATTSPQ